MGGFANNRFFQDVEIINLEDSVGTCSTAIADYPTKVIYPTLAYLDGALQSCGGITGVDGRECYSYDVGNNTWTRQTDLSESKDYPSSSLVGEDGWLIAGGPYPSGSTKTDLRIGGVSTPGPELPDGIYYGCQVTLNSTHVFIADGFDQWTYILDLEQGVFHEQV